MVNVEGRVTDRLEKALEKLHEEKDIDNIFKAIHDVRIALLYIKSPEVKIVG